MFSVCCSTVLLSILPKGGSDDGLAMVGAMIVSFMRERMCCISLPLLVHESVRKVAEKLLILTIYSEVMNAK